MYTDSSAIHDRTSTMGTPIHHEQAWLVSPNTDDRVSADRGPGRIGNSEHAPANAGHRSRPYVLCRQLATRRDSKTWFPIAREAPLVPGAYQARIVVRDKNNGRLGSLTHDFQVPAPAGLRISTPILSDLLREDGPLPGRAPQPIARRLFAPNGVLHVRFEVYGAAKDGGRPNVTAGFSIRRADGRFLAAAPETPLVPGPDGALARTLGTPLEGVPEGRYELVVVVTDLAGGQVAEAREAFEVVAKPEP
jgi:hypothetical protein